MIPFKIPKLGVEDEEVTVAEWLVSDGDQVRAGQAVVIVETDKAVHELEAPADGTLRIVVAAGDDAETHDVIGQIVPNA